MASATHRTIHVVELLEQILLHADYNDVIHALRVSKHFNTTILSSKPLRQKLWLDPANDNDEWACHPALGPLVGFKRAEIGSEIGDEIHAVLSVRCKPLAERVSLGHKMPASWERAHTYRVPRSIPEKTMGWYPVLHPYCSTCARDLFTYALGLDCKDLQGDMGLALADFVRECARLGEKYFGYHKEMAHGESCADEYRLELVFIKENTPED